ncbi:radical SAM protein [Actomonas aquatica]|uniref:Radical SAM protein n=1 Tax=Actomonas aquatica TaxID=2866162 RepID=A0ABZ1CHH2_9BACT|nr:radical SAM protein [Opitutus sp. WL0086]WRQ89715.1 radical SAM protein [Opitutus sp. WL0086]
MDRPYLFAELTNSLCSHCLGKVEAKIIFEGDRVMMHKHCPEHGAERVLISTDVEYYRRCRTTLKPGQMPDVFNTPTRWGCPYDCGLCPDHEQHSCLSLVEVTDACNLQCPICYAESSPHRVTHRSLEHIERMLDAVVRNEAEPDIVQISGGEPTVHPEFFAILDAAKRRPIKHLMLNTNGVRIAREPDFAARLADYQPGFEIYLQFDSLRPDPIKALRGADLLDVRRRALDRLNELNLSTTLVVTLKRGLNDDEMGDIVDFALQQPCVRGVTFQPIQDAGRTEGFDPATDRLTLGGVRQQFLQQTSVFAPDDIIPVPCHPDCLAMGYALKLGDQVTPLTSLIPPELLLKSEGSTIVFEQHPQLREEVFNLFSTSHSPESSAAALRQLLCCLPLVDAPPTLSYNNIFRVLFIQFLDAHNFDVRSVKKSCIHIVHPDGRIIPFDTYNLFYRDDRSHQLEALRRRQSTSVKS